MSFSLNTIVTCLCICGSCSLAFADTRDDVMIQVKMLSEPNKRQEAIDRLVRLGATAAPTLIHHLSSDDEAVVSGIVNVLKEMGPVVLPSVEPLLSKHDQNIRQIAASIIRSFGPRGRPAMPRLIAAMESSEDETRVVIMECFASIGDSRSLPTLVRYISSSNKKPVRIAALNAITQFKEDGANAIRPIIETLRSDLKMRRDFDIGQAAVTAIAAASGREPILVVDAILDKKNDSSLRNDLISALIENFQFHGRAKDPTPILSALLCVLETEHDRALRVAAGIAVSVLASKEDTDVIKRVEKLLRLRSGIERAKLLHALVVISPSQEIIVPMLRAGLAENDVDIRIASLSTAELLGDRAVPLLPDIRNMFADKDANIRLLCVHVFGAILDAPTDIIVLLRNAAEKDQSESVRHAATKALETHKKRTKWEHRRNRRVRSVSV